MDRFTNVDPLRDDVPYPSMKASFQVARQVATTNPSEGNSGVGNNSSQTNKSMKRGSYSSLEKKPKGTVEQEEECEPRLPAFSFATSNSFFNDVGGTLHMMGNPEMMDVMNALPQEIQVLTPVEKFKKKHRHKKKKNKKKRSKKDHPPARRRKVKQKDKVSKNDKPTSKVPAETRALPLLTESEDFAKKMQNKMSSKMKNIVRSTVATRQELDAKKDWNSLRENSRMILKEKMEKEKVSVYWPVKKTEEVPIKRGSKKKRLSKENERKKKAEERERLKLMQTFFQQ